MEASSNSTARNDWKTISCVVCAAAAVFFLGMQVAPLPGKVRLYLCMIGWTLGGMAFALWLIKIGKTAPAKGRSSKVDLLLLASATVLLPVTSYYYGMRQFGGADQGAVVDVGWRLFEGQRPYVDFPCTTPVGFYLGAEAAFRIFGVYWRSIVAFNALAVLVTLPWLHLVLRGVFQNTLLAFWMTLTGVLGTLVVASFWWYNTITTLAGVLFAASCAAVILSPRCTWRWISYAASLAFLAMVKPNVAAPLILGGALAAFASKQTWWRTLLASAVAFGVWFVAIRIHGSTIQQIIDGYLSVASRGLTLDRALGSFWPEKVSMAFTLVGSLVPWVGLPWARGGGQKPSWRIYLLSLSCMFAGLYGYFSNSDLGTIKVALLAFPSILILSRQENGFLTLSKPWTAFFTFWLATVTFLSVGQTVTRERVRTIGDFFEFVDDSSTYPTQFFTGLHSGPIFHSIVNEVAASRNTEHPFFALRLDWAYAAFNYSPPSGQPIWWESGATFKATDEPKYVKNWLDHDFDRVFIMDPTFLDDEFCNEIARRYGLASELKFKTDSPAPLHILERRDSTNLHLTPWKPKD